MRTKEKHKERKKKRNGGVWKKVKSKGMEESGRYIRVWRRKLRKKKRKKYILLCKYIILMSRMRK